MTEYWVSNSKHWCELCKCWLNDTPESRAHHERGSGHKLAVQRKLRDMRMKAERDAKEESRTRDQLQKLNEAADNAYKNDVKRMVRRWLQADTRVKRDHERPRPPVCTVAVAPPDVRGERAVA